MKTIYVSILLLLITLSTSAQSIENTSFPPDINVIQKEWRIEVRNPALDEDPFLANNELRQSERDRKETLRQNAIRIRQGKQPELPPVRMRAPEVARRESLTKYIYEVKVKNTGEKAIQMLIWEYVFFDPTTKQEVGRLQFVNKLNLLPGKTKNLVMRTLSPPSAIINANESGKKLRDQYLEQIFIHSIGYIDNSLWEASVQKSLNR